MSEQFQLNSELAQLENKLRSEPLPKASLDRDEVLYQAGWAAAMASVDATPAPAAPSNGTWKMLSGFMAAAAAVFALMWSMNLGVPNTPTAQVDDPTESLSPRDSDSTHEESPSEVQSNALARDHMAKVQPDPFRAVVTGDALSSSSLRPPPTVRRMNNVTIRKSGMFDVSPAKSHRELLDEMMPD